MFWYCFVTASSRHLHVLLVFASPAGRCLPFELLNGRRGLLANASDEGEGLSIDKLSNPDFCRTGRVYGNKLLACKVIPSPLRTQSRRS